MSYWQEKVVVITGGSSGLGFAFARDLTDRVANVVIVARDAERLDDAVEQLGCPERTMGLVADVTNTAEVQRLPHRVIERFGRVDALINCAGKSSRGQFLDTPLESFRELWELNTLAAIDCAQAFAPALKNTNGHLVNIGSLASKLASRFLGAYPTSKFPVAAISQQLRLEVQNDFHVLLVCPGPIIRADAGLRYDNSDVPAAAKQPGGGAKIKGLHPQRVVLATLRACQRRQAELILPGKVRMLLLLSAIRPSWGDWLLRKFSS